MNFFGNLRNVPGDIMGTCSIPYQNYSLFTAGNSKVKLQIQSIWYSISMVYPKLNLEFQEGGDGTDEIPR